ncbi:hybrid signal transduction histidine kinase A-like [Condylostylus longicornis]|uniref:hybrid signal transduction histidine kinase A-like n=1 Tax=Condylostylus longicornis TaxID=2530218 RepID=UPI00244E2D34|nr:hybrid signal transduction histidine kinase A-like [Condylostylus longicornis]
MRLLERLIWYCEICRRLKKLQVFFKISVCDDYSLPIDFVKKRPSSFDPCLAETLPDNWAVIAPSPLSEHVSFLDPPVPAFKHPPITLIQHQQYHQQQHIQQQQQQQHHHQQQQQQQQQYIQQQQQKSHIIQLSQPQYTNVKLIEGYSDPKDSRTQPRTNRRSRKDTTTINRNNYNSDSSAPKSSADDDDNKTNDNQLGSRKVPELNSPDSISEDLVHPLQPYKSPKRLTGIPEVHKRNPSPYYYSDLLKSKEKEETKEEKTKCRQSTASEPPQTAQTETQTPYRKSTSLDVPETNESVNSNECVISSETNKQEQRQHCQEQQKQQHQQQKTSTATKQKRLHKTLPTPENHSRRYSITEDGVRIIRCTSPSTTTSDDSDCSECQQRREWHAKALALVRKTCNVHANQPLQVGGFIESSGNGVDLQSVNILGNCGASGDPCDPSMPPHRILGPTVCACTAPATLNDDMDEYFRPRSVFYVHPQGVHECADCIPGPGSAGTTGSGRSNIINQNNTTNVTPIATLSSDKSNKSNRSIRSRSSGREQHTNEEDNMSSGGTGTGGSGRTRQIYETAFDCKVPKSDDDLDEVVERLTSHNALLEIENGNNLKTKPPLELKSKSLKTSKSNKLRYEGKRQKNTKNQQIQQDNGSNKNAIGSIQTLSNELENIHIDNNSVDQLNNTTNEATATTSVSQLPTRGYTPSPPSTAPLPVKFPGKHDRFFMNSIKSAPSLPSSNPAHPRLRDLRLPIKSLRQQQLGLSASVEDSAGTAQSDSVNNLLTGSNASSLLDSGTGQMVVTESSTHSSMSRTRDRPRSIVVLESGRVLELRTGSAHKTMNSNGGHHHHNHHHGVTIHNTKTEVNIQKNPNITQHQPHINKTTTINYSSTESMATSSSGGSMESLRSSTSEGNRSTTSSESRHSTSLSSHSSESGTSVAFPLRAPILLHSKLHILSPISDKSSLEPASDASEFNKKQTPPGGLNNGEDGTKIGQLSNIQEQEQKTCDNTNTNDRNGSNNINNVGSGGGGGGGCPSIQKQVKKRIPQNKALLMLTDEILGSDSGISLHSREDNKIQSAFHRFGLPKLNFSASEKLPDSGVNSVSIGLPQDLRDLPFDMPKLRRRKIILQQDVCTSGSATSVDLGDLPFDMPKLRRRLRMNSQQQQQINNLIVQSTESSGISQASSSHSVDQKPGLEGNLFRQNLTLNFNEIKSANNHKFGSLDLRGAPNLKGLNLNLSSSGIGYQSAVDLIDVTIPLERQGWYHGAITRLEAESTLRPLSEGSFLVRNCESTKQDYSLSLKGAKGFMHMRIQRNEANQYILGQFSRPFDSVPEMIRHFCINRLPVRGAEHMCLLDPVIVQLL